MDSPTELGIRALVRLLLSHNAVSDKDRNKAANLLKAHARSERGRYHIVQTGCIQEIVHLLLDPDVVVSVCCLVLNLAYAKATTEVSRLKLVEADVCGKLVQVLECARLDGKKAALGALLNLSLGSEDRKDRITFTEHLLVALAGCLEVGHDEVACRTAAVVTSLCIGDDMVSNDEKTPEEASFAAAVPPMPRPMPRCPDDTC